MKHILLPIDFSPRTPAAVRYAVTLARRFHSSLTVLHVLKPANIAFEIVGGGGEDPVQEVLAHQRIDVESKLQSFLADALQGFEVHCVLAEGDPGLVIVDFAQSKNVDLIVMPTRGYGTFRRFLLGSVTAKVLHDTLCPVLTTQHTEHIQPGITWELHEVLCAVNPGSGDDAIINWAHEFASAFGARLSIVHAIPSATMRPETYYLESDMSRLLARDARERIAKILSAARIPDAKIYVQNGGSTANVVRSVAQDQHADIVVIGRASGAGNRGRLRTDSYAIIRESPCPVISV